MDNKERYEDEVKSMSVAELKDILLNRNLHNGWLITSARKELEIRNVILTKDEIEKIEKAKKNNIDIAKESIKAKLDLDNPWFEYIDYRISSIQMDFNNKSYFSRVIKNTFYSFIFCWIFFGLIISISQHELSYQQVLISLIIAIGFAFIISLSSLVQERFYILNLKANKKGVEIKYLHFDNELYFQSDFESIEIIRTKTFEKFPKPILIIKKDGTRIIRLYTLVNDGLTEEKMDLLIDNLKKIKASH